MTLLLMRVTSDFKILPCGFSLMAVVTASAVLSTASPVPASEKKPHILVIMGDDVGRFDIGACRRGILSGRARNLDRLAAEGILFTKD